MDLLQQHSVSFALYQIGLLKRAADLHFSGKLQLDSLGDLVLDVPSALLRGCLAAVKEPGVELYLGDNWKARIVVIGKSELPQSQLSGKPQGGACLISERGKDFDYQIAGSRSEQTSAGKIWYLEIHSPDLIKIRQAYGLPGEPAGGFRAIFGIRRSGLFRDGNKVTKTLDVSKALNKSTSGGTEWVLKKRSSALKAISAPYAGMQPTEIGDFPDRWDMVSIPEGSHLLHIRQGATTPCGGVRSNEHSSKIDETDSMKAVKTGCSVETPMAPGKEQSPIKMSAVSGSAFAELVGRANEGPAGRTTDSASNEERAAGAPEIKKAGQHIFVTGHSGAGKSTLAQKLAEVSGMPLVTLDDDPRTKAFYKSDPGLLHTAPGTPQHLEWKKMHHDVVRDALAAAKTPSVIDGTYFLNAPTEVTANKGQTVLVDGSRDDILARRLTRMRMKRLAQGRPFDEAVTAANGHKIYDSYQPGVESVKSRPGTLTVLGGEADPHKVLNDLNRPLIKKADLLSDVNLQPHQQALADQIDPEHPARKLLAWQVGAGKSLGALAAAEAYGKPYSVIGPASIRPTFKSEQKKFTDLSTPSSVISYQKAMQEGGIPYPDSLVVDEAQRIVNPASRQSQAVQEAARKAQQVLLLSGTPIINRPGDFAPIMSILTGRDVTPAGFEARYMGQEAKPRTWGEWLSGRDKQYEPVIRHRDELKALLDGKVDWYTPSKPVVPAQYKDFEVEMGPEQSKLYRAMFGRIPWKLRLGLDDSTHLSPSELQQLRSFMSGPRQIGLSDYPFASHGDPLKSFYGSTKLQLMFKNLQEKLNADPRHKAIVYSNFPRAGLEPYRAILAHHNIPHILFDGSLSDAERDAAVRSFNEGRSRVALVGPAGAEGISLKGAQILQQMDPHWNEARMRQSAARGMRFDSHTDLPPELQNIEVQRYISKLPAKERSFLQTLRLMPYRSEPQPASDDYLRAISEKKEKSNQLFMDLLKEVGTRKQADYPRDTCDHDRWRQPDGVKFYQAFCDKCGSYLRGTRGSPGAVYQYFQIPDDFCPYCCGCAKRESTYFYKDLEDNKKEASQTSTTDPWLDACDLYTAQEQEAVKSAQLASVKLQEPCNRCGKALSSTLTSIGSSPTITCSCGNRTFLLASEDHKKQLIQAAADDTDHAPSQPQRQAGNYRKGKFGWHGLVISIENPKGSVRRGTDRSGKAWETELKDHYGYLLKHISEADGDHVDCFVGDDLNNQRCYVIDQFIDGKFDEHKVVLMAHDARDAKAIYDRNYQKDWDGFKNLSSMSLAEFKEWLNGDSENTGKPAFVKVTQADQDAVRKALQAIPESKRGADYGEVFLNARTKIAHLNIGDGWSSEEIEVAQKAVRSALPDWELKTDSECIPGGYDRENFGDWARVKA